MAKTGSGGGGFAIGLWTLLMIGFAGLVIVGLAVWFFTLC